MNTINIFSLVLILAIGTNQLFAKGIFWEAEVNNSKIYLLGSIHIAKKDTYPLDSTIEMSFSKCSNLVVEMNPNKLNHNLLSRKTMFEDTTNLLSVLPQGYAAFFDSVFRSNGIPKLLYNKFKPWFAVVTIINLELAKSFQSEIGIDFYFLKKIDSTKNIVELESFNEQADFLESIYNEFPEEFILYFVKELENSQENFDSLYSAWESGDVDRIFELTNDFHSNVGFEKRFIETLIYKRNIQMTQKIENMSLNKGCYFIIVGAGHLVGSNGIINLLKKQGYKVKRLI